MWPHAACVCLSAILLVGAPVAVAASATGSASGVRLAREIAVATARVPAVSFVRRGYTWASAVEGQASFVRDTVGEGPAVGEAPATEHALAALQDGRIVWWRDAITEAPCTAPGVCARIPFVLVGDSTGVFFAFGSITKHTCYGRFTGAAPLAVNGQQWVAYGTFRQPVTSGATTRLTSTFPWAVRGVARVATEIDSVSARSHLVVSSRDTVTAPRGHAGSPLAWTTHYTYPATAPAAPAINACQ